MTFHETMLKGAFVVELDKVDDDRGFFARSFCAREFEQHGLRSNVAQVNISQNHEKGTIRGMHYQISPASEPKLIRCIRGAIWDVIIDMRPSSDTYLQHIRVELSADNRVAIYVPDMFAHGYQAITDGAEILYLVGEFYTPGCERGVRYDDPAIGINWPLPVTMISAKDANWPLLEDQSIKLRPRSSM